MAVNAPSLILIPPLMSNKNMGGKLLRKPRAPQPLPAIPVTPSSSPAKAGSDYERHTPSSKPFYEIYDFETDQYSSHVHDTGARHSPTPSVVPSLVSPPPPSESNPARRAYHRQYSHIRPYITPQSTLSYINRDDKKYILDPLFREKTSLGSYVDGKSLVKPYKTRGPDSLPARPPRRNPDIMYSVDFSDDVRFYEPPAFTLENFLIQIAEIHHIPLRRVREAVCSRHNYKKFTKLLAEEFIYPPIQQEVHTQHLTPEGQNIPPAEPRIPQRQLLIEMAAMIKQHVRDLMNADVKTVIKPLKKYSPSYKNGAAPHTEIILFEDDAAELASRNTQLKQESEIPAEDAMFHSARSRYFQGTGRSQSPFAAPEEGVISPSEVAILESLLVGGKVLSLKANFISELPDISALVKTLTYLNLSFNDLNGFPSEVLDIHQLEVLKMRNNPLRELPHDIHRLKTLKTLVISFCLISSLPITLFSMHNIEFLDISYNKISFIPNEISQMEYLHELNLEGNQLPAMPSGALRLSLQSLNVKNNFMHPLFWKENTQNQPQRLIDLAAHAMYNADLHGKPELYPESVQKVLANRTNCDCCHGVLYGPGLRIIRPVSKLFGIRNLPFLFSACSPDCLWNFKNSKDTLSDILYGTEDMEPETGDKQDQTL